VCLALTRVLRFHEGYWACISTVVVMQSETRATVSASRDRLVGTAVGALVGWGAATWWHGHLLVYAVAILIGMVVPDAMGLKGAGRLAGVAVSIIMLVPNPTSHWVVARDRFLEVSFGIVVALLVSKLIWGDTVDKVDLPGGRAKANAEAGPPPAAKDDNDKGVGEKPHVRREAV
jgi:uncharacterized membrane protein YccC